MLVSESLRAEDVTGASVWEYEQGMMSLGASAVLDNIWLSGHLAGGTREWENSIREQDVGHIDLTFGYYFNRKLGLLAGIKRDTVEEGFMEQSTGTFSIGGVYYFRNNIHLSASLLRRTVEYTQPGVKVETQESGIDLAFGMLF
jgi:hypothetical protein